MKKPYKIEAFWDDEARVWVAEGINVPGLCTEAPSIPALMKKLKVMVPEILQANGLLKPNLAAVSFEVIPSKISGVAEWNA